MSQYTEPPYSQLLEHLNLALHKRGPLSIEAELVNELLNVGPELHLTVVLSLLVLEALAAGTQEVLVVPSAVNRL